MARSRSEKIQDAYQKGKDQAYTGRSDLGKTTAVDVVADVIKIGLTGGLLDDSDQSAIDAAKREGYKDGMAEREQSKQ